MSVIKFALCFAFLLISTIVEAKYRQKRYSHGKQAEKNAWPSQVLILTGEEFYRVCGGAIINEQWILTAAHCVRTNEEGRDPMQYKLILGEYDRSKEDGTEVRRNIAEIVRNPDYEMQNHSNDIALIKMDKPVDFAGSESHLKPACLDLNGLEKNLDNETRCVATGFGRLGRGNAPLPDVLQQLDMKPYDHADCARTHRIFYEWEESKEEVTDKQFCMVSKDNAQPDFGVSYGGGCLGDSGGPLQCFINNNWIQIGVAWSVTDCEQNPTVFQKIYKYADFIKNTSNYTLPPSCNVLLLTSSFLNDDSDDEKQSTEQTERDDQQPTKGGDKGEQNKNQSSGKKGGKDDHDEQKGTKGDQGGKKQPRKSPQFNPRPGGKGQNEQKSTKSGQGGKRPQFKPRPAVKGQNEPKGTKGDQEDKKQPEKSPPIKGKDGQNEKKGSKGSQEDEKQAQRRPWGKRQPGGYIKIDGVKQ